MVEIGISLELTILSLLSYFPYIFFIWWRLLVNGIGKGRSTGTFCGNSLYEVNIDGRSFYFGIYKYVKKGDVRDMGCICDMSDFPDLRETAVDMVKRDFTESKIGSCLTILELENAVACAKVIAVPYIQVVGFDDIMCEPVNGWDAPNFLTISS